MKSRINRSNTSVSKYAFYSARVLADWWTQPDRDRMCLWSTPEYQEGVATAWEKWSPHFRTSVETLMSAFALERDDLKQEYERLFVGPAAIPCPPYEAVWREDRPKHEQGTVNGSSTSEVRQLYAELGVQLAAGQVELADHVAVELEALAYATAIGDSQRIDQLMNHLRRWLPAFCESVRANSQVEFYSDLATITMSFLTTSKAQGFDAMTYAGMQGAEESERLDVR